MIDHQNIFNQDFYPTPLEVIERMLVGVDVSGKYVLDPSAGTGNILNCCAKMGAKTYACEINEQWRKIVGKNHELVGSDFLQMREDEVSHINLIVMNPPFSEEEKHLLHAWEIAAGGCEIISLCNAEMLNRYNYNHYRKELYDIIQDNGSSEELGNVFATSSERRTNVNVALIHIFKPKTGDNEFDDYFTMEADEEEEQGEGLMSYNVVRDAVNRYVSAVSKYDEAMRKANEINDLTSSIGGGNIKFGAYWNSSSDERYKDITREVFKKNLQKKAWRWIFNKFDMQKFVTRDVYADINKRIEQQSNIPFTMKNVYKMIDAIIGTHESRMKKMVCDIFDKVCKFSADNITVCETWKTNSAHMLNRKFIVPAVFECDVYGHGISTRTFERDVLEDICKVLCFIMGERYEDDKFTARNISNIEAGVWYTWGFFKIKGHKKGTMHLEFLDETVWARFNQAVSEIRGFSLPVKTKEKAVKRTKSKIEEIVIPANYVTLEEAKLIKKIGFNKSVHSHYSKYDGELKFYKEFNSYDYNEGSIYERYSAPTYSELNGWFQRNHEKGEHWIDTDGDKEQGYVYSLYEGHWYKMERVKIFEDTTRYATEDEAMKAGVQFVIERHVKSRFM